MSTKQASEFRRGERVKHVAPGLLDRTGIVFGTNASMVFVEFHDIRLKHDNVELCHPDSLEKF